MDNSFFGSKFNIVGTFFNKKNVNNVTSFYFWTTQMYRKSTGTNIFMVFKFKILNFSYNSELYHPKT